MDILYRPAQSTEGNYAYILESLEKILSETEDLTAALANASSLLYMQLPNLNWAGFYLMKDGALILGPFQGKPAVMKIDVGTGVCGTAVKERSVQVVSDVHACENHIACDLNSRSEIVIPLWKRGEIFGVLDIDSPVPGRFAPEDEKGLTAFAGRLSEWL